MSHPSSDRRPWEAPALVVIDAKETRSGAFPTPNENGSISNPPTTTTLGSPPS